MYELPGPKLATAIRVNDRPHRASLRHSIIQCGHRQRGLHPGVDRVADDPVRPGVLDRAEMQFAFVGAVFGDVGQPQLVRGLCGELTVDEVIVDRWAGLPVQASLLREHRPDAFL